MTGFKIRIDGLPQFFKKEVHSLQVLAKIALLLFKGGKYGPYSFIDYLIVAVIQPCLPVADGGYLPPLVPLCRINLRADIDLAPSPLKGKQSVNDGRHIPPRLP